MSEENVNISAAQVKELREKSGAPMMDCKKALVEAKGDIEAAIVLLRKRGVSLAGKKAARVTSRTMAASMSPLASTRAFLQSIMGAPLFSRSSFTCAAEIFTFSSLIVVLI